MNRNQSFAARLHNMENGISGVQNNPEIQGLMSQDGYTPERVADGQVKLANVKWLTALQITLLVVFLQQCIKNLEEAKTTVFHVFGNLEEVKYCNYN
jgi:hypothetical protein